MWEVVLVGGGRKLGFEILKGACWYCGGYCSGRRVVYSELYGIEAIERVGELLL
jgi:hypothetical protein